MGLAFEAINPDIFPVALELFKSGMDRFEIAGEIFKRFGKKWNVPENKLHTSMIDLSITEAELCFNSSIISNDVTNNSSVMKSKLGISFFYDWISVKKENEEKYNYPEDRKLIKKEYKRAAIYKWNIYDAKNKNIKKIYIGETVNLYNRVSGYLRPGTTQKTNIRINEIFNENHKKKCKITLDVLYFENMKINNKIINPTDLIDNDIRKALEHLLIIIYKSKKYELLNLG
jgi:hypothetical protein